MRATWLVFIGQAQYRINPNPVVMAEAALEFQRRVANYFAGQQVDLITEAEWAQFAANRMLRPEAAITQPMSAPTSEAGQAVPTTIPVQASTRP